MSSAKRQIWTAGEADIREKAKRARRPSINVNLYDAVY